MKKNIIQGKLVGNARGYAFLVPDQPLSEDYFIPHSDLRGAMHGDYVMCESTSGTGNRTTARVLKILERGIKEIVGTYFTCRTGGFVTPDDGKYFTDVFVPFGKGLRARSGDKVVCKILAYPKKKNPEGIISKILGRQFEKKAELKSILHTYSLSAVYPSGAVKEIEHAEDSINDVNIRNRKDLRKELTFTIDGEYAKDFDDAVSLVKSKDAYLLGVHIADVSEFVKFGGLLDGEAFARGTSVYFPEQVIPMLPEKLCNDLCSLREGVDRLTLSCIMEIDKSGKITDTEIVPSVIRSSKRFTYTEVQKIIDGDKQALKVNSPFVETISNMKELADILHSKRNKNGSIDLDVKECTVNVNKEGKIEVLPASKDDAHGIIEEFMIAANCAVAEYFYYLDLPFVYRIHEKPQTEKVENFYDFLSGLGITVKRKKDEIFPKDFQNILKISENSPAYPLVNRVMLRSMQKAKYSPEEVGHFGLGEKFYCHFTSPIRRYPDLAIHRIIKDFYKNGQEFVLKKYGDYVKELSSRSSERERNAQEAERAVDDYYKMLYISDYVGEEFDAIISGVTNFGIFAEIDCGIEGLIKIETLKGKRYVLDEKNYLLSDGNKKYKLGQKIKVKIAGIDYSQKRSDMLLVE